MLALNLLSPREKLDSTLQWNYIIIKNVILMILVVTFVISTVLFSTKVVLLKKLKEAEEQAALVNNSQNNTNQDIIQINKELGYIKTAQKDFIPWSTPIWYFLQTVPQGITISNIKIQTSDSIIKIEGVADSRDILLSFKNELENTEFIKELYLPLNNLLQKTDIQFNMTITLDLKKIDLYN